MCEVMCDDPLAPFHLQYSSKKADSAAELAERIKSHKYRDLGFDYYSHPSVSKSLGARDLGAHSFYKIISIKLINTPRRVKMSFNYFFGPTFSF